jgi:hypothetical protein
VSRESARGNLTDTWLHPLRASELMLLDELLAQIDIGQNPSGVHGHVNLCD